MRLGLSLGFAPKASMSSNRFPRFVYMLYSQMCILIGSEEIDCLLRGCKSLSDRLTNGLRSVDVRSTSYFIVAHNHTACASHPLPLR